LNRTTAAELTHGMVGLQFLELFEAGRLWVGEFTFLNSSLRHSLASGIISCFFCAAESKRRALTPAIWWYLIGDVTRELVLFCPDFGQEGRHCHNVFRKLEVGSVVVSIALLIIVNTSEKKCFRKTKDLVVTPSKKPGTASDGANLFSFSRENCEKLKRFAPSKTDSENHF
jgi:hypothetical protein